MPTPTYDLIASNVLNSSAASVTFSSIPATYRDLIIVANATRSAAGSSYTVIRFNGDSGNNYSYVSMDGNGSTTASTAGSADSYIPPSAQYANTNDTTRNVCIFQVMDYSVTDKHKTVISRANNSALTASATAGRWANTAAVNQVDVVLLSGSFASGSSFYLFGISA